MPLTYRHATPDDLPFIIGLIVEDSVVATNDDPADAMHADYANALAAIDADPNQEMFVVERDGEPVGCFQLSYLPGLMRRGMWRGQIEVVHVERPRSAIAASAREMMRWALERCREKRLRHGAADLQQEARSTPTASTCGSASSRATKASSTTSRAFSTAPSRTITSPGMP